MKFASTRARFDTRAVRFAYAALATVLYRLLSRVFTASWSEKHRSQLDETQRAARNTVQTCMWIRSITAASEVNKAALHSNDILAEFKANLLHNQRTFSLVSTTHLRS